MKKMIFAGMALSSFGAFGAGAAASEDPELFAGRKMPQKELFAALFPPQVKTVAVISPASHPGKPLYRQGLENLLKSGLKVKVGKHVFAAPRPGMTSAPLAARLEDFYAAWNDPEVDFILCMRGGEGCTELLEALDWRKLAPRPELYLQGYSDVTQIICAMQSKKIGRPVAGPMVGALAGLREDCLREMSDMHRGRQVGPVTLTPLVAGDCGGLPLAGHLERISRSWASPFPPDTKGRIIFLENVNSSVEKSRALLEGLLEKGFFRGAAGVVFCQFVRCGDEAAVDSLLREFAPKPGIPVYKGFPFGHSSNSYTMDFQRHVVIRDNQLTFPAVK